MAPLYSRAVYNQERLLIVLCTWNSSYKLVVVGGGAGGCSTAAKFASKYPGQVAVIEPRDVRFFKPILIRYIHYGNTGCGVFVFQKKLEGFLPKRINIIKGNYRILRIGLKGRCQKVPKFDFQNQISMSKMIRIFLIFFSLKNIHSGAPFFVMDIFDNIIF